MFPLKLIYLIVKDYVGLDPNTRDFYKIKISILGNSMEAVVQNLTEIDHYGDKETKFSHFDKFGTMFRFHIQGSYTYQTKVGSLFTLLFYILVSCSFIYYLMKFADTTRPLVVMSEYEAEEELSFNIAKDQHILYWQAT
jgi:hypothetical protein